MNEKDYSILSETIDNPYRCYKDFLSGDRPVIISQDVPLVFTNIKPENVATPVIIEEPENKRKKKKKIVPSTDLTKATNDELLKALTRALDSPKISKDDKYSPPKFTGTVAEIMKEVEQAV